mmetsp:Transcript_6377/g.17764  ORF Transcript_6377/g.17764 Transcript_6377/m.17764 type:complete len:354 (-) Transcript_6377:155-1216(-)
MHDGSCLKIEDISVGQAVKSGGGSSIVTAVHHYPLSKPWMGCTLGDLVISPGHPVLWMGAWRRPFEVVQPEQIESVHAVYNLELDAGPEDRTVEVNGVTCSTLGWRSQDAQHLIETDAGKMADALWGAGWHDSARRSSILKQLGLSHRVHGPWCDENHDASQLRQSRVVAVLRDDFDASNWSVVSICAMYLSLELTSDAHVFRRADVLLRGRTFVPPPADQVSGLMEQLCTTSKAFLDAGWTWWSLASLALWSVNAIHPFPDGNGRTARCLCFLVLDRASCVPNDLTLQSFHQLFFAHGAREAYFLSLQMTDDAIGKLFLKPEENLLATVPEANFAPIVAFLRKTLSVSETSD